MSIRHNRPWSPLNRFAQVSLITAGLIAGASTDVAHAQETIIPLNPDMRVVPLGNQNYQILAADGAIIDYARFDVNLGRFVRFLGDSPNFRVLNRVHSVDASMIAGMITADNQGRIYLVNPAGIAFQNGAMVDTGAFYAVAGDISNGDFMSGTDRFSLSGAVTTESGAVIRGSNLYLLGRSVRNGGTLEGTGGGIIAMVAGNSVTFTEGPTGRIQVSVDGRDLETAWAGGTAPDRMATPAVENTGTIRNDAGRVILGAGDMVSLAFRNSGRIEAAGGEITIGAVDGLVHNTSTGVIDTGNAGGSAGIITVNAPSVLSDGRILADGAGGMINVVGYNHTFLAAGSLTSASGDGGRIRIGSNTGLTIGQAGSNVLATGGVAGGNGGNVEVFGKSFVYNGTIDTGAPAGTMGTTSFTFSGALGEDLEITLAGMNDTLDFTRTVSGGHIRAATLSGLNGNLGLMSAGDIKIGAFPFDPSFTSLNVTPGSNIALDAAGNVFINASLVGANDLTASAGNTVWIHAALDLAGDASFTGTAIQFRGRTLSTRGRQDYVGNVFLGFDSEITATEANFANGVYSRSVDGPLASLTLNANAIFGGDVGGDGSPGQLSRRLQSLTVSGTTAINGGNVRTVGFQRYAGAATIGADATLISEQAGDITFGSTLNGPHDLLVRTGGVTSFLGTVGGLSPLASVTTDAAGTTFIAANMAAGDMTFNDAVLLGADVTAAGSRTVTFNSTVTGNGNDLVINSPATTFNGNVTGIGLLQTDAAGTTIINASQILTQAADFNDAVVAARDTFIQGVQFVDFDRTLDGAVNVAVDSARLVRFGGNVGTINRLGSLTVTSGGTGVVDQNVIVFDGTQVRTIGDILLNPQGKSIPTLVASIAGNSSLTMETLNGNIFMGQNEKMTSLGDLSLIAVNGTATLGDLNAVNNINVNAANILLRTRVAGNLFNYLGEIIEDRGMEVIAGGSITFNRTPGLLGTGTLPIIATTTGGSISPSLLGFTIRSIPGLTAEQFTLNPVLDLTVPFASDLATAYDTELKFNDKVELDPFALRALEAIGLTMRPLNESELVGIATGRELYNDTPSSALAPERVAPITTARLRRESVLKVLDQHQALFHRHPTTGEPSDDQSEHIRTILTWAWEDYLQQPTREISFRAFLEQVPDHAEALAYVDGLEFLFREIWTMGATPYELQGCLDKVIAQIKPLQMDRDSLEQTIGVASIAPVDHTAQGTSPRRRPLG